MILLPREKNVGEQVHPLELYDLLFPKLILKQWRL